jgi:tetratricopeptide (TPR) repeat protein
MRLRQQWLLARRWIGNWHCAVAAACRDEARYHELGEQGRARRGRAAACRRGDGGTAETGRGRLDAWNNGVAARSAVEDVQPPAADQHVVSCSTAQSVSAGTADQDVVAVTEAPQLAHLNRAIEIEPDYPLARALAAWCKAREVIYNWTLELDEAKAEGLRLAKLAGDMNNDDPMVLTALCAAHSVVGDLEVASALIEKALALDPNSAMAWNRSGWLNAFLDRPEVAIEQFQHAIRLSPFDPMNFNCYFGIRNAHFAARRYDESLLWCRKGMVERPELVWPLRSMAASLALLGRISEAREAVRKLREGYPDITISKIVAITPHRGDYVRRYAEGLRRAGLPE